MSVLVGCWGVIWGNEEGIVDSKVEWEVLSDICVGVYYGWSDS